MNIEPSHDKSEVLSIGVRLRCAREQVGLSQQAVAERLCLKVSIIRDIEEDKVPTDLALTFLRGYIRSYAKLVDISEDEVISMMRDQVPALQSEKITQIQSLLLDKSHKNSNNWLISFTWILVFLVITLSIIWLYKNYKFQQKEINNITIPLFNDLKKSLNNGTKIEPIKSINKSDNNNIFQDENPICNNTIKQIDMNISTQRILKNKTDFLLGQEKNNLKPNTHLIESKQGNVNTSSDSNTLIINFTDDCWLDIRDITGKQLFIGLKRKNELLNLTGKRPYNIIIGAPSAVKIEFQGKLIDLSRFIKSNKVARFTVSDTSINNQIPQ